MDVDDEAPSPIGELIEGLTAFVGDVAEENADGWARVERMRVTMPVEFYVRRDDGETGTGVAIESRPADRTLTSMMPVLHGLTIVVEVEGAEHR
jgi:hypothetical protein